MKRANLTVDKYRNIGVMAHIDAGKTTVSERILFYTGRIHSMGEVHNGDTVLDDDPREQKKGITINAAATTVYWDHDTDSFRINLIDTPGHIDFTVEVERSLRVLDGAICVLDASQGVEPQTEQVWRQADRYNVSRIVFVNKMDKVGANFQSSLNSMSDRLGVKAIPIQIPLGEEDNFQGVIDLINMQMISFSDRDYGKTLIINEIPANLLNKAEIARNNMIEMLSDVDDHIAQKFIDDDLESISKQDIKRALRTGTISRKIFPVLCGSALRNKGIQMLLDAVIDYLPSPIDLPNIIGIDPKTKESIFRSLSDKEPLSALAFKIVSDPNGNLTFIRVYSGVLRSGSYVYNVTRDKSERVSRLVLVHASSKEPIEFAEAGTIVAAVGLKGTYTGDTLCDKSKPIVLEKMDFPAPVVELSVEAKTNADLDKLANALGKLLLEDPSLQIHTDEDTQQTILKGMGELHLEIVVDKLRTDHGVGVNTGKPRVSYRETITTSGFSDYLHKSQNGGHGQYGHVVINIEPGERGSGFVFKSNIVGGVIPKEFIPSIEKGIKSSLQKGVISGNPMVDVAITLVDGSTHSVDGSSYAFEIAASHALQEAAKSAKPIILEPIMSVSVTAPREFMGDVIGIISARSGQIKNTFDSGNAKIIEADMPLRRLFGFTTDLRGNTQGRAVPSVMFSHYDLCSLKPSELDK
ncbi:FusA Translation elongation factors (GTPases) [uncultured Caudovirales phage]|uniref:FusA Translation elongation factors (GTPases) n=1 Tax=uncultured Caudovirales phage TaxID=2100421 RepID=A0A6J5RX87_9CAUD|nr:FusA Translation elongation factors (GTPases) [uncultured Caudovirales phage]